MNEYADCVRWVISIYDQVDGSALGRFPILITHFRQTLAAVGLYESSRPCFYEIRASDL
ncbi:hypothetical protein QFZ78_002582 [Paenibacillus sp. V4I5]|nr:hypothetical protein [Paenibacillus sp. V4I5]